MMNAVLQESGLSQNMWEEALLTTNYILNKIPHKILAKLHMNYRKVIYLRINTSKCGGAWKKLWYRHQGRSLLDLKQWTVSSSNMHITVVLIDLWYINLKYQTFMSIQSWKQGSKRTREERDNGKDSETETNVKISINDTSENEEKDEHRRSKRAR